jgi:DNA replication and repair protein RecF
VLRKKYNIDATLIIDDIKSELDTSTFEVFLNLLNFLDNQVIFSCIDDDFSSKMDHSYKDFKKFHVEQLR